MPISKYLYLTRTEWVTTWVEGGEIPISLASSYLRDDRDGIYTPDENLIHESSIDVTKIPNVRVDPKVNIKNLTVTNNWTGYTRHPDVLNAFYYRDDGLILSFCNKKRKSICKRLNKRACVKILDMEALKLHIDTQLGVKGVMKACEYTSDHRRNHFLKSSEDSWQDEYRIFWPNTEQQKVTIPAKTARRIIL